MTRAPGDDPLAYRAGACNIGPAEIAARRRLGIIQLLGAIGIALALVVLATPAWTRLAVWPILAGAFVTLEQVRRRFCVAFGFAGVRNFGPLGRAERVDDAIARATDRRAALLLTVYCSVAAAILTAVFVAVAR
jgi:hypothetical protein